jgi:hypothetical protein
MELLLLELPELDAFLAVGFGFCGALGIDATFGEEVGAAAGYYEGCPAVAMGQLAWYFRCTECICAWCMVHGAWESEWQEGAIEVGCGGWECAVCWYKWCEDWVT